MTDQPGREKALRIATDYTTAAEAASGERQALADEILALVREEREAAAIAVDQWPIVRNLEAKLAASEQSLQEAVAQLAGAERLFAGSLAGGERLLDAMRERAEKAERERDEVSHRRNEDYARFCRQRAIDLKELADARARIAALESAIRERYAEILREEGKP